MVFLNLTLGPWVEIIINQWLVLMIAFGHCVTMYILSVLFEPHMRLAKENWQRRIRSRHFFRGAFSDIELYPTLPSRWKPKANGKKDPEMLQRKL